MTEEEAKTKWYPMTRFHVAMDGDVYDNKPENALRNKASPESVLCIASDCMIWKWDTGPTEGRPGKGHCGLSNT